MSNEQKQKLYFVRLAPLESCVLDLKPCLENVDDSEGIGKRLKTKILPSKLRQTQERVFREQVSPLIMLPTPVVRLPQTIQGSQARQSPWGQEDPARPVSS